MILSGRGRMFDMHQHAPPTAGTQGPKPNGTAREPLTTAPAGASTSAGLPLDRPARGLPCPAMTDDDPTAWLGDPVAMHVTGAGDVVVSAPPRERGTLVITLVRAADRGPEQERTRYVRARQPRRRTRTAEGARGWHRGARGARRLVTAPDWDDEGRWKDDGVHVVNDATRTRSHLAIPGRPAAVCGEPTEGDEDLGVLVVPPRDSEAPPCMACIEIWSTWRGIGAWEGEGLPTRLRRRPAPH